MSIKKRICVITGSRSEYGLMKGLLRKILENENFELKIIATGSHFSEKHGLTYREIEDDGFLIDYKLPGNVNTEHLTELAKTLGSWTGQFADALTNINPDLVLVMGDRYELLAVSNACILLSIPLAHLSGGDITEGAMDDQIRHVLTKSAHLHIVVNQDCADRVLQMGEESWRVSISGEPGLDDLMDCDKFSREELSGNLGLDLSRPTALVTFHPATLEGEFLKEQIFELVTSLQNSNLQFVITYPNADPGSEMIIKELSAFTDKNSHRAVMFKSLGRKRYASLLNYAVMMIGNSSSGLVEAPIFNLPVVNIGNRQSGRVSSTNVFHAACKNKDIQEGIHWAMQYDRTKPCFSPYGDGASGNVICSFLFNTLSRKTRSELLRKRFVGALPVKLPRQIGGHFEINPSIFLNKLDQTWTKSFHLDRNAELVGSGRGAFQFILDEIQIKNKVILMPEYLCGEAQIPVLNAREVNYKYYRVSKNLTISFDDIRPLLGPETHAVVLINYYGLSNHATLAAKIKKYNPDIYLLEDCSQAFYSLANNDPLKHWADYSYCSFLKSVPVPDGGCVRGKKPFAQNFFSLPKSDQGIEYFIGGLIKNHYLSEIDRYDESSAKEVQNAYLNFFEAAAEQVPEGSMGMSALSQKMMSYFPYKEWAKRRIENYHYLVDSLTDCSFIKPIFRNLVEQKVPLFFPVIVSDGQRDNLREFLRAKNIYCPVHWPLIPELNNSEHPNAVFLSHTILSLPVDHRLNNGDMKRMTDSIVEYWRNK